VGTSALKAMRDTPVLRREGIILEALGVGLDKPTAVKIGTDSLAETLGYSLEAAKGPEVGSLPLQKPSLRCGSGPQSVPL